MAELRTQMPGPSQRKALLIRPLEGRLHFGETQEDDAGGVPSSFLLGQPMSAAAVVSDPEA